MHAKPEPFHAIAVSRLAHELAASGRSVIHMEFGQPSTGAPAAAIAVAHQVLDTQPMGYWESPPLKARLARLYQDRYAVALTPDRIVLTCGASPALVLALTTLFTPGARVALARPGYVAYRNTLRALHMNALEIPCGPEHRYQLTAAALAAISPPPDGVIVASPANPTGTIIPAAELAAIAALCAERRIQIVSDEIYHGLSYEGATHSLLEFTSDAAVINSFSKYYSMAGWRLGWLVMPAAGATQAAATGGNLFLTPPALAQHAALAALDATAELQSHLDTYRANRRLLLDAMPALGLPSIAPPDGAFYIYASVAHLTDDSLAFCKRLLADTGVALAPGIDFDPTHGHAFIRFSFAVSTAEVKDAIARLAPWLARQARRDAVLPKRSGSTAVQV